MTQNRLIHEKSPYLLQHAHNPVDWHPWSEEAFRRAEAEDKPVFLSIGYATCHWCHVMERESFEDPEAAGHLNDAFICIKVDREERPDIDAVYMTVCHMLTGSGGWPLNLILTPQKKPFFAGTYIPRTTRFGRPGLIDICRQVKALWSSEREKLVASAADISGALSGVFKFKPADGTDPDIPARAFSELESRYDSLQGGFGSAPKFPSPHQFLFLLRHHHRTGNAKALEMVRKTLTAMRLGGIWDHVGYGFHRYATDREWLVPHFEKMLYDQALIAMAYLEAYQVTRESEFARTARDIFAYVLRDMTSPEGAFFSAEDADSEGEEGKFYVWTAPEFREVVGEEKAGRWEKILNVALAGNFADEATGRRTGANILHLKEPLENWAGKTGIPEDELFREWEAIRNRLFEKRVLRVPPLKDDKILTDWNGLMIAALSLGARVLAAPEYARAAERAASFLLERMRDASGRLLHRYREGEAAISAVANDYAFLIMGLIELYQATYDPPHLENAALLQERMMKDFRDPENGWFYLTPEGSTELPARPIELQDGALPSANSVSLINLLRLSRLTGEAKWENGASDIIRAFSGTVGDHPSAYTHFLLGIDFVLNPGEEIVISGDPAASDTRELLSALNLQFSPGRVSLVKTEENAGKLAEIAGFTAGLERVHGKATAHICKGFSCKEPTTDAEEFIRKISSYK